ncbi:MAG: efflux RND transporter periplasmic adaptor subunit [Pirellulales bacterium]|jgi:cobalt-zinc-cadmium efflux system membrane fusion protein|nr:efflux RND transporter periplasmic adaptor subunit [Pirellulales bacterium]MDI9443676.1 efflux RND transporter periplasmic adaptor subunit [Planctomycetota bacterium]NLZ01428.1 efflux RND transporter periplasmic adaptor subunit [Pirellulaceae bacterium]
MTGRAVLLVACLLAIGLPSGGCGGSAATADGPVPAQRQSLSGEAVVRLSSASLELAGVELARVDAHKGRRVLKAMGKILAPQPQTAIVSYSFPGRVAAVHAEVGDWVEEGQTVIVLESQEVGEAKSEFFKLIAALELAKLNLEREKRLVENGIGVKKGLVAAEADYVMAQANAEAAEKRLHVLGFTEERVKEITETHEISPKVMLTAPVSGKVVASKAILGGMVDQTVEIMTIVDPRRLWADAEVYEKDLAKMKVGQAVEICVPAYPGEAFHGTVSYIGDLVDEETRTITVRTDVANGDLRLKPGMFANVCILRNGGEPMVLVPASAVLEEGKRKLVFVKTADGFAPREVATRAVEGDEVEIVKGLDVGEEIVVRGNHQLKSELQRELLEASHAH